MASTGRQAWRGVIIALLLLGTTACTRRMLDFTVISSKNVALRRAADSKADRVEGKDEIYWLLWIPLGTPNLKEAVDRAIESAGPEYDALIDGVVYSYNYWFVVSGVSGYRVTGTPVVSRSLQVGMLQGHPLLYHSRTGKSNAAALAAIPVVKVDRNGKPIGPASTPREASPAAGDSVVHE